MNTLKELFGSKKFMMGLGYIIIALGAFLSHDPTAISFVKAQLMPLFLAMIGAQGIADAGKNSVLPKQILSYMKEKATESGKPLSKMQFPKDFF